MKLKKVLPMNQANCQAPLDSDDQYGVLGRIGEFGLSRRRQHTQRQQFLLKALGLGQVTGF